VKATLAEQADGLTSGHARRAPVLTAVLEAVALAVGGRAGVRLLGRLVDAAFAECRFPARRAEGWRAQLELAVRTLWAMFRQHPWLAPALSVTRPQPIHSGIGCAEWVLSSFDGLGPDQSTLLTIYLTLVNYVRGTAVNLELEADAAASSGLNIEEWLDTREPVMRAIVRRAVSQSSNASPLPITTSIWRTCLSSGYSACSTASPHSEMADPDRAPGAVCHEPAITRARSDAPRTATGGSSRGAGSALSRCPPASRHR
jgi:hypothetical protein